MLPLNFQVDVVAPDGQPVQTEFHRVMDLSELVVGHHYLMASTRVSGLKAYYSSPDALRALDYVAAAIGSVVPMQLDIVAVKPVALKDGGLYTNSVWRGEGWRYDVVTDQFVQESA